MEGHANAIHSRGLFHNDIRLENVLVLFGAKSVHINESKFRIRLIDFNIVQDENTDFWEKKGCHYKFNGITATPELLPLKEATPLRILLTPFMAFKLQTESCRVCKDLWNLSTTKDKDMDMDMDMDSFILFVEGNKCLNPLIINFFRDWSTKIRRCFGRGKDANTPKDVFNNVKGTKGDVYRFGLVLLMILMASVPSNGNSTLHKRDITLLSKILDLILRMMEPNPDERITMQEARKKYDSIIKDALDAQDKKKVINKLDKGGKKKDTDVETKKEIQVEKTKKENQKQKTTAGRKKKLDRDEVLLGVTNSAVRRLARRGDVKRISNSIYNEAQTVIEEFLKKIIINAVTYTEHSRRKTMTANDVVYALKRQGCVLYGFGG